MTSGRREMDDPGRQKGSGSYRENFLHGVIVTETLSGSLVWHHKCTSKFGLPSFCKQSRTSMSAMNLGALLFALENFATSVARKPSQSANDGSSALLSFEVNSTHIFIKRVQQYTITAILFRGIHVEGGEAFVKSLCDRVSSTNFSFDKTAGRKANFLPLIAQAFDETVQCCMGNFLTCLWENSKNPLQKDHARRQFQEPFLICVHTFSNPGASNGDTQSKPETLSSMLQKKATYMKQKLKGLMTATNTTGTAPAPEANVQEPEEKFRCSMFKCSLRDGKFSFGKEHGMDQSQADSIARATSKAFADDAARSELGVRQGGWKFLALAAGDMEWVAFSDGNVCVSHSIFDLGCVDSLATGSLLYSPNGIQTVNSLVQLHVQAVTLNES